MGYARTAWPEFVKHQWAGASVSFSTKDGRPAVSAELARYLKPRFHAFMPGRPRSCGRPWSYSNSHGRSDDDGLSKQIAGDIGIAEATVKVHRSRLMRKMKARSLPALCRMADKLKLVPEEPQRS
jgi:hypothetical protein